MSLYISPEALEDVKNWAGINEPTILPPDVFGEAPSYKDKAFQYLKGDYEPVGEFDCHLQKITISADLGRFPIQELGRVQPYKI